MDSMRDKVKVLIRRRIDEIRPVENSQERKEVHEFARGMIFLAMSLGILTTSEGLDLQRYLQLVHNRLVLDDVQN